MIPMKIHIPSTTVLSAYETQSGSVRDWNASGHKVESSPQALKRAEIDFLLCASSFDRRNERRICFTLAHE
jgi:hypothetical protein